MKFIKSCKMVGMGIILLIALLMGTHTAQTASPPTTNVGNVEFVLLKSQGSNLEGGDFFSEFKKIFPDATTDSTPFRIPDGKVLVVTDANYQINSGRVNLQMRNLQDNNIVAEVLIFEYPPATGTRSLNTGFVISNAAKIIPQVTAGSDVTGYITVTGYLRPAP